MHNLGESELFSETVLMFWFMMTMMTAHQAEGVRGSSLLFQKLEHSLCRDATLASRCSILTSGGL